MSRALHKRQVITAMGVSCALGDGVDALFRGLMAGESRTSAPPFQLPFRTVVGAVPGTLDALPAAQRAYDTRLTRIAQRALSQVSAAVEATRLRLGSDRIGVIVGTSTGGLDATEPAYRVYRETQHHHDGFTLRRAHAFDALAVWLRETLRLSGPTYAVSTACTSSAKAVASARRLLRTDVCDAVLIAGVDALCETTVRGFHGLSVLSEQAARPFSSQRDGIHIGEAAALFLLENEGEGATYVRGIGESSDAHSMSAPHPDGLGAALAMQGALRDAGIAPDQVDYINAHGTGTEQNDAAEAAAMRTVFGEQSPPVSSTKGVTGHTLGACGALEAIACAVAIQRGELPKSTGAEPVDPSLHIQVLRDSVRRPIHYALSNALAFGGNNISLLLAAS